MLLIQEFISWLTDLLTYKGQRDVRPTLYHRDTGPICYEAELFQDAEGLTEFIQTLLSGGLEWYWTSARQYEPLEEYKSWNLPDWRSSTYLTRDTSNLLHQDFLEEDVDYTKRGVELIGVNTGTSLSINKTEFEKVIEDFLNDRNSAIKVIINRICDTRPLYVFVPQKPVPELTDLLNRWNLRKDNVEHQRRYRALHLAKLEDMKEGIIHLFVNTDDSSDAEP